MFEDQSIIKIEKSLHDEIMTYLAKIKDKQIPHFKNELREIPKNPMAFVYGLKPGKHENITPQPETVDVLKEGMKEFVAFLRVKGKNGDTEAIAIRNKINLSQHNTAPRAIQINVQPPGETPKPVE